MDGDHKMCLSNEEKNLISQYERGVLMSVKMRIRNTASHHQCPCFPFSLRLEYGVEQPCGILTFCPTWS